MTLQMLSLRLFVTFIHKFFKYMLKKHLFLLIWFVASFFLVACPVFAQEDQSLEQGIIQAQEQADDQAAAPEEAEKINEPQRQLKAVAGEDESIAVSRVEWCL